MNVHCNQHLVKIISGNNERSSHIIPLILHLLRLIRSCFFLRDKKIEKKIIFSSSLPTFLHSEWDLHPRRNYLVVLCIRKFEKLKMHLWILDKLFNFENNIWKLQINSNINLHDADNVIQKEFLKFVEFKSSINQPVIQKSSTTIEIIVHDLLTRIVQIKLNLLMTYHQ